MARCYPQTSWLKQTHLLDVRPQETTASRITEYSIWARALERVQILQLLGRMPSMHQRYQQNSKGKQLANLADSSLANLLKFLLQMGARLPDIINNMPSSVDDGDSGVPPPTAAGLRGAGTSDKMLAPETGATSSSSSLGPNNSKPVASQVGTSTLELNNGKPIASETGATSSSSTIGTNNGKPVASETGVTSSSSTQGTNNGKPEASETGVTSSSSTQGTNNGKPVTQAASIGPYLLSLIWNAQNQQFVFKGVAGVFGLFLMSKFYRYSALFNVLRLRYVPKNRLAFNGRILGKQVTGEDIAKQLDVKTYFQVRQENTAIYYGPSGRGKSFCAEMLAEHLSNQGFPCIYLSFSKFTSESEQEVKQLHEHINQTFRVPTYFTFPTGRKQFMPFYKHINYISQNLREASQNSLQRIFLGSTFLSPSLFSTLLITSLPLDPSTITAAGLSLLLNVYWVRRPLLWMCYPKPLMVILDDVSSYIKKKELLPILNNLASEGNNKSGIRVTYLSSQRQAVLKYKQTTILWKKLAVLKKFHPGQLYRQDYWTANQEMAAKEFQQQFGFPPKEEMGWAKGLRELIAESDYDYRKIIEVIKQRKPESVAQLKLALQKVYEARIREVLNEDLAKKEEYISKLQAQLNELKIELEPKTEPKTESKKESKSEQLLEISDQSLVPVLLKLDLLQQTHQYHQFRNSNKLAAQTLKKTLQKMRKKMETSSPNQGGK